MTMEVGALSVKLTLDNQDFMIGLKDLGKSLKDTGKELTDIGGKLTTSLTVPIAAAAGGIFALASQTANYADRLLDLTDITGMSSQSIQEWGYVAKMAGVDGETVTGAVEGLVKRLPQLQAEGGKATEGLKKMGLSFSDLEKMSPDDMINTLITELSKMEDPMERNAIGSQLFGAEWKNLAPILGMGTDAITKAKDEAQSMGAVMSEEALKDADDFRVGIEQLKTQFGGLGKEIASKFLPILTKDVIPFIENSVIPAFNKIADVIGDVITWFQNLSPKTQQFIMIMVGVLAAIGPVVSIVGQLVTVIGFLMSPIGLVIAAIVALIAIGVLLWQNWDIIKEKAGQIWDGVKKGFEGLWNGIKEFFSSFIKGGVLGLVNDYILKPFFDIDLFDVGKQILESLFKGLVDFWNTIKDKVSGIGTAIADAMSGKTVSPITYDLNVGKVPSTTAVQAKTTSTTVPLGGGQTIIINSPTALSPAVVAKETTKLSRSLALGLY